MTITEITQRLITTGTPHRISRAAGVPIAERWLFQHPDRGWITCSDTARMAAAKHLLFLMYLISTGAVTDAVADAEDGVTEAMILRAAAIPTGPRRGKRVGE